MPPLVAAAPVVLVAGADAATVAPAAVPSMEAASPMTATAAPASVSPMRLRSGTCDLLGVMYRSL